MSGKTREIRFAVGFTLGVIAACIVGYFVLWGPAERLQQQVNLSASNYSIDYEDGAYISPDCTPVMLAEKVQSNCIDSENEAAREARRSQRNLAAQQTTALWTQAMGKAAIIGTGVGIVGLFLIFVTFWETRKAANFAAKQLDAFYESERAVIHAVGGGVGTSDMRDGQFVMVELKNRGSKSGRIVRMGCETPPDAEEPESIAPRWSVIEPGATKDEALVPVPPKNVRLSINCWVEYKSVGPKIYTSYFEVVVFYSDPSEETDMIMKALPSWQVRVSNASGHPDDT